MLFTRSEARRLFEANPERIVSVTFTKRTNGESRHMRCVFFPTHADRALFRFNPNARGLLPVWDIDKAAPRFVNLDGVTDFVAAGVHAKPETIAAFEEVKARTDAIFA